MNDQFVDPDEANISGEEEVVAPSASKTQKTSQNQSKRSKLKHFSEDNPGYSALARSSRPRPPPNFDPDELSDEASEALKGFEFIFQTLRQ